MKNVRWPRSVVSAANRALSTAGAARTSGHRERSRTALPSSTERVPMFSGGGRLSAAQQALWTIAHQRTLAPARKTRRQSQRAGLPCDRPAPRPTTAPSTDPPLARPALARHRHGGSRRGACRRSGPGARPSVRVWLGAAGFPGGGMWPLKRHRPRRLLRCAHEPAAGKQGNPFRQDDTAVLPPLSFGRMSGCAAVDNALLASSRRYGPHSRFHNWSTESRTVVARRHRRGRHRRGRHRRGRGDRRRGLAVGRSSDRADSPQRIRSVRPPAGRRRARRRPSRPGPASARAGRRR